MPHAQKITAEAIQQSRQINGADMSNISHVGAQLKEPTNRPEIARSENAGK
jgi:hypothetical protein